MNRPRNVPMDADALDHLCKLSAVAVNLINNPTFLDEFLDADRSEQKNIVTCLQILGDGFTELARRQPVRPRFRVPAVTRPRQI